MDKIVYILCGVTCFLCAALLLRGYLRSGMRLLLWATICFSCFFIGNIFVYLDLVVFPDLPLLIYRDIATFAGLSILIYGMIWETV